MLIDDELLQAICQAIYKNFCKPFALKLYGILIKNIAFYGIKWYTLDRLKTDSKTNLKMYLLFLKYQSMDLFLTGYTGIVFLV